MRELPDTSSLPAPLQRIALVLRTFGRIALLLQSILGVVSLVIILLGIAANRLGNSQEIQGIGFGIFLAICGLVTLGVGVYIAWCYTRISQKLLVGNTETRPSKAETLKTIRLGLIVNMAGMLLTILGAQAIIGSTVLRSMNQPSGIVWSEANRFVRPIDLFLVQANINTITAHFAGIAVAIWLFNRINR